MIIMQIVQSDNAASCPPCLAGEEYPVLTKIWDNIEDIVFDDCERRRSGPSREK